MFEELSGDLLLYCCLILSFGLLLTGLGGTGLVDEEVGLGFDMVDLMACRDEGGFLSWIVWVGLVIGCLG